MNFKMGDDKKGGPAGVVFEHNLWFTEELSPFQTQRCAVGQVFTYSLCGLVGREDRN